MEIIEQKIIACLAVINLKNDSKLLKRLNQLALIAILFMLFEKPAKFSIGRSSTLASMVADLYIIGSYEYYPGPRRGIFESLSSAVFSLFQIKEIIKKNWKEIRITITYDQGNWERSIDKTKIMRYLLQDILNSPQFVNDKYFIENVANSIGNTITESNSTSAEFLKKLQGQIIKYKETVTATFFNRPNEPNYISILIAEFLRKSDAANLARTSKKARDAARNNSPFKKK